MQHKIGAQTVAAPSLPTFHDDCILDRRAQIECGHPI